MSGPPTPPLTSAIELEDAARTSGAPNVVQATAPPPTELVQQPAASIAVQPAPLATNPYSQAFPTISGLAANARFQELVDAAELSDLHASQDAHVDRLLIVVPLVLSYLILDDTPPAVHALQRLPDILTATPLPQVLFRLVASVSERSYENVYPRATDVYDLAQRPEFVPSDLKLVITGLLDKFIEQFRRNTFGLLSRAYTSVPLALARTYLNMPAEQLLTVASDHRWKFDESTQTLFPVPLSKDRNTARSQSQSDLTTFSMIANMNLE